MGSLEYATGSGDVIPFDDRTLTHLQFVIGAKLRLRQSFFFSWLNSADDGGGRSSIWLDATIPLAFSYASPERPRINREWLELLMSSANSTGGLQLIAEPQAPQEPDEAREPVVPSERRWSPADAVVGA